MNLKGWLIITDSRREYEIIANKRRLSQMIAATSESQQTVAASNLEYLIAAADVKRKQKIIAHNTE